MRRHLQNQLLSPAHRIIAAKTRSLWLELPYWASNEGNFRGAGPSKSSTWGFFFRSLFFTTAHGRWLSQTPAFLFCTGEGTCQRST